MTTGVDDGLFFKNLNSYMNCYKSRHFHFAQNQTKSLCFDNALTLSLIISYTFYTEAQIKGNNETSHVKLIARVV